MKTKNNLMQIILEKIDRKLINYRIKVNELFSTAITYFLCYVKGIEIGKGCRFIGIPILRKHENSRIRIGNNVVLRSDKKSLAIGVTRKCIIATLKQNALIEINDNSSFSGTVIAAESSIKIGMNVLGGANCTITDTDWHNVNPQKRREPGTQKSSPVIIDDNVWIGYSAIILKGVTIGKNSIIGPLSVVHRPIPMNSVAAGNPCQIVKELI